MKKIIDKDTAIKLTKDNPENLPSLLNGKYQEQIDKLQEKK